MHQPHTVTDFPPSSRPAKRILLGLGFLLLVGLALGLAWWCYVWTQASNRLKATIANVDREDPGWRWEELQARRIAVPDAENAAFRVEAAFKLLPRGWPSQPVGTTSANKTCVDQILDLEPNVQLNPEQVKALRVELEKVKPALDEARKLAGLPTGRYPAIRSEDVTSAMYLDRIQKPRPVANLLLAEAALLAQDGQADAALTSCRSILNAGRSLGDEPLALAQLVRMAGRGLAVVAVERVLAQGQPAEEALRAGQELLQDEEHRPLLLHALRGERASAHEQMGWMETGNLQRMSGGTVTNNWLQQLSSRLNAGWLKENHVRLLECMTEGVEIAKLPLEEQADRIRAVHQRLKTMGDTPQGANQVFVTMAFASFVKLADACTRTRAELRCAIAALAAERYRLAHHDWPDSLEKLVPTFLPQLPIDPYDRKPLRYQRVEDGVAIYSVGPDGKDDGGKLDRKNRTAPGTDMVFRLWDTAHRRRPPATGKP